MSEQPVSIEASGSNIEAAIEAGLAELGVDRMAVTVEVINEGSRGLLGIGSREAQVRLTVMARAAATSDAVPMAPHPPSEPSAPQATEKEQAPPPRPKATKPTPQQAIGETDAKAVEIGIEVLEELLERMNVEATVEQKPTEGPPWMLEVQGRDLGVLIGRRGETLNALQYITRLIVSREIQGRSNIIVDVEGYKARREALLIRLAVRMAEQAVQQGRTVALEPMSPYERRIVHMALQDDSSVTTDSVGEGDKRKVTIIPR